jgi:hypothetical protein
MKRINNLFLTACALLLPASTGAQTYELRGRQQIGQGLARPRGAECLIVAPLHVVVDSLAITATGEDGTPVDVRVIREYNRADVAILQFTGPRAGHCPEWNIPSDLSVRLSDASVSAVLRVRNGDAITSIPVWIRRADNEYVTITPRLSDDHFSAGMSGGQLLVNGVFAGILLSTELIREDGRVSSESVRVLRSDVLDRLIDGFFTGPPPIEEAGNRPPAPLGVPSDEPDLWLPTGRTVVLGDQNTAFAVSQAYVGWLAIRINGEPNQMPAGSRFSFPDSRGDCFIMYLRTDDPGGKLDGTERHAFAIRCNPK